MKRILVAILLASTLAGCSQAPTTGASPTPTAAQTQAQATVAPEVGRWVRDEDKAFFEFFSSGRVALAAPSETKTGTYKLEGDKLSITWDGKEKDEATVKFEGDKMSVKHEDEPEVKLTREAPGGGKVPPELVGLWENKEKDKTDVSEFTDRGTLLFTSEYSDGQRGAATAKFEVEGDKITVHPDFDPENKPFPGAFKVEGDTLTISENSNVTTLKRKK